MWRQPTPATMVATERVGRSTVEGTTMKTRTQRRAGSARVAAALAAGALSALMVAGPATASIDDGVAGPDDGTPAGVDVGLAKHGNMPPLTDIETGVSSTSSDDGLPYMEIGLGALSGAALTAAAVVAFGARRHGRPNPA